MIYHWSDNGKDNKYMKCKFLWDLYVVIQVSNDDIPTTLKKTDHTCGYIVWGLLGHVNYHMITETNKLIEGKS